MLLLTSCSNTSLLIIYNPSYSWDFNPNTSASRLWFFNHEVLYFGTFFAFVIRKWMLVTSLRIPQRSIFGPFFCIQLTLLHTLKSVLIIDVQTIPEFYTFLRIMLLLPQNIYLIMTYSQNIRYWLISSKCSKYSIWTIVRQIL